MAADMLKGWGKALGFTLIALLRHPVRTSLKCPYGMCEAREGGMDAKGLLCKSVRHGWRKRPRAPGG